MAIERGGGVPSIGRNRRSSRTRAIQIPLCLEFKSIWDYSAAFINGDIDFAKAIGRTCPICGRKDCWRRIGAYERDVVELFPYRKHGVAVARFRCTFTHATFSLLPVQLIPYFRYTTSSVVGAILAMWILVRDNKMTRFGRLLERTEMIDADSQVTVWLLETWLHAVLTGLRRTHPMLPACRLDLLGDRIVQTRVEGVGQVALYFGTWGVRSPPDHSAETLCVFVRHGRSTNQFLVGTPSQSRRR